MKIELTDQERISLEIMLEYRLVECDIRQDRDPVYYAEETATAQAILAKIYAAKQAIMREEQDRDGDAAEFAREEADYRAYQRRTGDADD